VNKEIRQNFQNLLASGQKGRGFGGRPQHQSKARCWVKIFARLPSPPKADNGMGKRFRNSATAEGQNRKIFIPLIEKN